jgi:membrane associated rhomboid family serine protease
LTPVVSETASLNQILSFEDADHRRRCRRESTCISGCRAVSFCIVRRAPKWTQFPQYPAIAGTAILAIAITIAWWCKFSISPLFATAMVRRGELWRLVTSMFPHADILHLGFNIYWLWVFGTLVEEVFGHFKTAGLIVLFALGSGSLEFAFAMGGVGLSGVVYGMFGLLWVLAPRDDRFRDGVDQNTILLFVGWFFFCILATVMNIFPVGNIAHGAGAVLGILTAIAIILPRRRIFIVASIGAILLIGLWGSTLGRPKINLSGKAGYEEGKWGYEALVAGRDKEAARWFGDAVIYQPNLSAYWFDLGIAYQKLGNKTAAQAAYQRAHQLEPNEAQYSEALKGLD